MSDTDGDIRRNFDDVHSWPPNEVNHTPEKAAEETAECIMSDRGNKRNPNGSPQGSPQGSPPKKANQNHTPWKANVDAANVSAIPPVSISELDRTERSGQKETEEQNYGSLTYTEERVLEDNSAEQQRRRPRSVRASSVEEPSPVPSLNVTPASLQAADDSKQNNAAATTISDGFTISTDPKAKVINKDEPHNQFFEWAKNPATLIELLKIVGRLAKIVAGILLLALLSAYAALFSTPSCQKTTLDVLVADIYGPQDENAARRSVVLAALRKQVARCRDEYQDENGTTQHGWVAGVVAALELASLLIPNEQPATLLAHLTETIDDPLSHAQAEELKKWLTENEPVTEPDSLSGESRTERHSKEMKATLTENETTGTGVVSGDLLPTIQNFLMLREYEMMWWVIKTWKDSIE